MDPSVTLTRENPKKSANIFSEAIFGWLMRLFYKGTKKELKITDLYKTMSPDESEPLGDKLEKHWKNEMNRAKLKNTKPSLLRAVAKTFFWNYMLLGLIQFVQYVGIRAYQPVILSHLIHLFSQENTETTIDEMYIYGGILVLMSFVLVFLTHHTMFRLSRIGMRIRIACSALIYRKILNLSQKSLGQTTIGNVVNLLSNDVNRFDLIVLVLHQLWIGLFMIPLITYYIWEQVGISALAGVLSMILFSIPVQGYMGKQIAKFRFKAAARTDYRVRLMNEIISGVQVIKMYAWEKPFETIVKSARANEIAMLTKAWYFKAVFLSSMVYLERLSLFLTVICYVLLGNSITADKVFSMVQFFNILQLFTAIFFPMIVSNGSEALIALKRLEQFLVRDEKELTAITNGEKKDVICKNVEAVWDEETFKFQNLSIDIKPGSLCAIIGPVGAGKSSILQLLLGELPFKSGEVTIGGTISYASQKPWLFVSTVKNNILFGQEFDQELYKNIIKICALEPDLKQLPQGDKTYVGERGVSLSGGQRARINLARAVYRNADIYLLDDPLSAVDTHVGKHLFEECILKYLKNKTRILITHQLQYLRRADHIIIINDGKIEAQGTYEELSFNTSGFATMLTGADETQEEVKRKLSTASLKSVDSSETNGREVEPMGDLDSSPYKEYISASGSVLILVLLALILILGQSFCNGADLWISYWTQQEELRQSNASQDLIETNFAMYIYIIFIVGAITFTLLRSFVYIKVVMNASRNLHSKIFQALLQVPMRFFDTNPSGRILNRFSKDMGAVDELLPNVLIETIQIMLVMVGILVMVSVANPYMIIAIVILGALFIKIRSWYLCTVKDVKRIEGILKSPVFSHLNASLNGIVTIRALKAEIALKQEFDSHQDVHTSAWFIMISAVSAFGLILDMICSVFVACITFSFILIMQYGSIAGSSVGLAISQSLILTGMLQYGARQTTEVVNQMISVERVLQYTKLDTEGPFLTLKEKKPPKTWPNEGRVIFKKLHLKYAVNDPYVLKNLNFTIHPGQKIGIVGRTGAGKSSLISALFRLTTIEGDIIIDNINTQDIGLTDLRKRISIIPQEPVLFSATMRYNLDPFNEYDDSSLWDVLEEVELKDVVQSLDFVILEGGANFSLGQRQLICLARAILRNSKILILDEATANVDPRTDELIQATIRKKFQSCTVLTIAHRLNTIMDSDRVAVMESGEMVEFDHPFKLLQTQGYFYKMVQETGPNMTEKLQETAFTAYNRQEKLQISQL